MEVTAQSFLILDSTMFSAFKICGGDYQEKIWTEQNQETQKLEKFDHRLRKTQINLEFLVNCSNSVVSKFLNFRVASKSLKFRRTYQQCQLSLLHEEIRHLI